MVQSVILMCRSVTIWNRWEALWCDNSVSLRGKGCQAHGKIELIISATDRFLKWNYKARNFYNQIIFGAICCISYQVFFWTQATSLYSFSVPWFLFYLKFVNRAYVCIDSVLVVWQTAQTFLSIPWLQRHRSGTLQCKNRNKCKLSRNHVNQAWCRKINFYDDTSCRSESTKLSSKFRPLFSQAE